MIGRSDILQALPPVLSRRDVIKDNQETTDIIREVLEAHAFFANDYEKVAEFFDRGDLDVVHLELFDFCKRNVRYVIEKESLQTTKSPAALIAAGHGDCKHYAGFIGGVLDALKRKGRNINWCYRFASYSLFNSSPQHVFVVVKDRDGEVWIDPVLKQLDARSPAPYYKLDKKPIMALQRIYGAPVGFIPGYDKLLAARAANTAATTSRPPIGAASAFNLNIAKSWPLVDEYLKLFTTGAYYQAQVLGDDTKYNPPIKYTVDGAPFALPVPAFILRSKGQAVGRAPQGLQVVYPATWKGKPVPSNMLRPIITPGGEMLIQAGDGKTMYNFPGTTGSATIQMLCADGNRLLNLLVAAVGSIQVAFQAEPDAENKQRIYDRVIRMRNGNFMVRHDVKTVVGSAAKGLADAVAVIGKGFIQFIGIIPRQAFLLMVKLNVADTAKNLDANVVKGRGAEIKKKWEGFGGDYGTLVNNINQGKGKNRIFGVEHGDIIIGSVDGIGELTVAAAIAAAAPVIALLASFLKGVGGPEVDKLVDNAIGQINGLLAAAGEDPIALSEAMGGKPVTINIPGTTTSPGGTLTLPAKPGGDGDLFDWIDNNKGTTAAIAAGAYILYKNRRRIQR